MSSETDDCKRPWDHAADYYAVGDVERFEHETLDECIESHLEFRFDDLLDSIAGGVTVEAWARDSMDVESEARDCLDDAVESMSLRILENYGDPEGESKDVFGAEIEETFKASVMPALMFMLKTVTVWKCSKVGERTFAAEELLAWVKQNHPEWLEGKT